MKNIWDYIILDSNPPAYNLSGLACGDIDGDGNVEIFAEGEGGDGLIWYRPSTMKKGVIKRDSSFAAALELEDIDKDGKLELLAGEYNRRKVDYDDCMLVWYKNRSDIGKSWVRNTIAGSIGGYAHDAIFIDIDKDSENELIANACYSDTPAIYIFKRRVITVALKVTIA